MFNMFLQGQTVDTRWQWNATVGPLVDRPGRVGDWSYVNTEQVPFRFVTLQTDKAVVALASLST